MRLLSFSVSNFRSFLVEQTITFDSGSKNVDAILGPNGSGKSNLFWALGFFRDFIRLSTKFEGQTMQYMSFIFNDKSEMLPTSLQAEMQTTKYTYKYHFSILLGEIKDEALSRKLNSGNSGYETLFSRRSLDKNRYEKYGFDSSMLKSTRADALVLTKAWENNNKYALDVFEWLDHLKLVSGNQPINQTAQKMVEDSNFKTKLLDLLHRADLSIQDITASKINLPEEVFNNLPIKDEFKKGMDRTGYNLMTTHIVRSSNGEVVDTKQLPMSLESEGTRRIFELAFPVIDTLKHGNILYVDEFENHLHPRECEFLVELFTGEENTSESQLIINTHNTQVIDQVGRNNVHLLGKNSREETMIAGIPKDVRTDDPALEKKYNKGVFGAVPNVG